MLSVLDSASDFGITYIMFISLLNIMNKLVQIHDVELRLQSNCSRSQSWIFYLSYVHLESSSQLNLCLINNKFNYLEH